MKTRKNTTEHDKIKQYILIFPFFEVEVPDPKETTSVLLQNMLDRLMVLEKQVENVVAQSALDISDLSQKVKSLNQSLRSFTWNFTRGTYSVIERQK